MKKVKFIVLHDWSDHFEIKNKTLIVHSNPIKGKSGEFAITDPEVYNN